VSFLCGNIMFTAVRTCVHSFSFRFHIYAFDSFNPPAGKAISPTSPIHICAKEDRRRNASSSLHFFLEIQFGQRRHRTRVKRPLHHVAF